jgi:flagellar motor switch protein FliN/FliY
MDHPNVKQDINSGEPQTIASQAGLVPINSDLLRGVRISLDARLGRAGMTVDEMMALQKGSVVTLETGLADHVDLYLGNALVARGEIVAVGDNYGVRIVEIAPPR